MIQGLNIEGLRAISMIRIKLVIGDLSTSSIFHIIDAKTSYKLLLMHPPLHGHRIVASTLHQCLKYYRRGERKINDSVKAFTKAGLILHMQGSLRKMTPLRRPCQ